MWEMAALALCGHARVMMVGEAPCATSASAALFRNRSAPPNGSYLARMRASFIAAQAIFWVREAFAEDSRIDVRRAVAAAAALGLVVCRFVISLL